MIKEAVIEDFQSHEKTVIPFAKGYNCLVGPTDIGKSSCLRAVRWVLCNDLSGVKFIRNTGTTAVVQLTFDNDHRVTRFKSRKTSNGYRIELPGSEPRVYDKIGDALPLEVIAETGVVPVAVDGGWDVFPQFQGQFDAPFLISESPSRRAKLLHRLSYSHIVDEALRLTRQDVLSTSRRTTELTEREASLRTELEQYAGLEEKIEYAKQVQILLNEHAALTLKLRQAQSLVTSSAYQKYKAEAAQKKLTALIGVQLTEWDAALTAMSKWVALIPSYRSAVAKKERAVKRMSHLPPTLDTQLASLDTFSQWATFFTKWRQAATSFAKAKTGLADTEKALQEFSVLAKQLAVCPTCGKALTPEELNTLVVGVA